MSEAIKSAVDGAAIQRAFAGELIRGDSAYGANTNADAAAACLEAYATGADVSNHPQAVREKVEAVLHAFAAKCDELQIAPDARAKIVKNVVEMLSYGQ